MVNGNDEHTGRGQPPPISCSLFVKPPVAGDRTVTIDRLTALRAAGAIEAVEITTVRDEILLAEAGDLRERTDLGDAFEPLVEWTNGDLVPTFEPAAGTSRMGRSVRRVEPPAITLAVYERDELRCVFPCEDDERTWDVEDFLDSFEADGSFPPGIELGLSANWAANMSRRREPPT